MKFEKEVVFKPNHKLKIAVLIISLIGCFFLKLLSTIDNKVIYGIGILTISLLLMEIYKQSQYDFILKINQHVLSYKNDKKIFKLKEIESFYIVPQTYHTPPKLMVSHKGKMELLLLENYNKLKLKEVSRVLNEKIGELQKN